MFLYQYRTRLSGIPTRYEQASCVFLGVMDCLQAEFHKARNCVLQLQEKEPNLAETSRMVMGYLQILPLSQPVLLEQLSELPEELKLFYDQEGKVQKLNEDLQRVLGELRVAKEVLEQRFGSIPEAFLPFAHTIRTLQVGYDTGRKYLRGYSPELLQLPPENPEARFYLINLVGISELLKHGQKEFKDQLPKLPKELKMWFEWTETQKQSQKVAPLLEELLQIKGVLEKRFGPVLEKLLDPSKIKQFSDLASQLLQIQQQILNHHGERASLIEKGRKLAREAKALCATLGPIEQLKNEFGRLIPPMMEQDGFENNIFVSLEVLLHFFAEVRL